MLICEILNVKRRPSEDLRNQHAQYLIRQGEKGNLVLAGRFSDFTGGLMVWKVVSMGEAIKLARHDPYLVRKIATFVLKEWFLSFNYGTNLPTFPSPK